MSLSELTTWVAWNLQKKPTYFLSLLCLSERKATSLNRAFPIKAPCRRRFPLCFTILVSFLQLLEEFTHSNLFTSSLCVSAFLAASCVLSLEWVVKLMRHSESLTFLMAAQSQRWQLQWGGNRNLFIAKRIQNAHPIYALTIGQETITPRDNVRFLSTTVI